MVYWNSIEECDAGESVQSESEPRNGIARLWPANGASANLHRDCRVLCAGKHVRCDDFSDESNWSTW